MMNKEEDITNWEKDAPLLSSIKKENCFNVPEFYYNELSEKIISQIKIEEAVEKHNSFKTPNNYFEGLAENIQSAILLDESKDLLKLNNAGFHTPDKYFETSKNDILNHAVTKKSSIRKLVSIKFIRYAAAACILISTSLGIYFNIQRSNSIDYQLSKVSDDAIESYLEQNVEASDVPIIIENLDDKPVFSLKETQLNEADLDAYLKSTL